MIDRDPRIEARIRQVQALFSELPRNQEFCPAIVASSFAESLGLDSKHVLEILQTPKIQLYPDVPAFIERSFNVGSLPIIWTQGEVGECDPWSLTYDPETIGFQPLKIIRSGMMELLRPWKYMYDHYGLSPIVGGGNKVEPGILAPVMSNARLNGFDSLVGIDDRSDMLTLLKSGLLHYPFQEAALYNMIRESNQLEPGPFLQVQSLHEVELGPRVLCLLDFDRTAAATDPMKVEMMSRLALL